tara:strand:- start:399 stop:974 length:576 start_codon:yes stop_codon:yes gene_type:complete
MIETSNADKDLSFFQKYFLVFLSILLVISLFFFRNGFKANAMLDQLAKNSLLPEQALSNGRPTVLEFYADWCEACKDMAPDMIEVKKQMSNKVDVVLLNVDNSRWLDLIDKYDVNGIPQLNFFDDKGEFKGFSLGVRKYSELNEIFLALINNSELPSFTKSSNSVTLLSESSFTEDSLNNTIKSEAPRNHS